MQQLPLIGGSYSARSEIANCQICLNLYPEVNRKDSPAAVTHYQRPGLEAIVASMTSGVARGLYQATNGDCYVAVGTKVYFIDANWTAHDIGSIASAYTDIASVANATMVSMVDNGIELLVVAGAPYAGNAAGDIAFAANPGPGDTVTLNGVVWTFVAASPTGNQVLIGADTIFTVENLFNAVSASSNAALTVAVYNWAGPGPGTGTFLVQYKLPGAIGTEYSLTASVATPSAATLEVGYGNIFTPPGWIASLGNMASNALVAISDANWTGADRVDFLDTFIVGNVPGTNQFWSTLSNDILPVDATQVAAKTSWADPLAGVVVCRGEVFLPGVLKSEIWYDAGAPDFPFARLSGTEIPHGVGAKYSLATADLNIYWLSRDSQGQYMVFRLRAHEAVRISNFALEYRLRKEYQAGVDLSDAVGFCQQIDGHLFYVLTFPTANMTWCWDESNGDPEMGWSQRGFTGNGGFDRDRVLLGGLFYGKNVGLDWQYGTLYELKLDTYTDEVNSVEYPITYTRSFPHLMTGMGPQGVQLANGLMVQHDTFMLDASVGTADPGTANPQFVLRWSDDRGVTWSSTVLQSAGVPGKYITRPTWKGIGQAQDRVYEVSWSFPGQVALNGAWVDGRVLNT